MENSLGEAFVCRGFLFLIDGFLYCMILRGGKAWLERQNIRLQGLRRRRALVNMPGFPLKSCQQMKTRSRPMFLRPEASTHVSSLPAQIVNYLPQRVAPGVVSQGMHLSTLPEWCQGFAWMQSIACKLHLTQMDARASSPGDSCSIQV